MSGFAGADRIDATRVRRRRRVERRERIADRRDRDRAGLGDVEAGTLGRAAVDDEGVETRRLDRRAEVVVRGRHRRLAWPPRSGHRPACRRCRAPGRSSSRRAVLHEHRGTGRQADRQPQRSGHLHRLREPLHDRVALARPRPDRPRRRRRIRRPYRSSSEPSESLPPHATSTPPAIIVVRNVRRDHIATTIGAPWHRPSAGVEVTR